MKIIRSLQTQRLESLGNITPIITPKKRLNVKHTGNK